MSFIVFTSESCKVSGKRSVYITLTITKFSMRSSWPVEHKASAKLCKTKVNNYNSSFWSFKILSIQNSLLKQKHFPWKNKLFKSPTGSLIYKLNTRSFIKFIIFSFIFVLNCTWPFAFNKVDSWERQERDQDVTKVRLWPTSSREWLSLPSNIKITYTYKHLFLIF